jgi:hypothetical protein
MSPRDEQTGLREGEWTIGVDPVEHNVDDQLQFILAALIRELGHNVVHPDIGTEYGVQTFKIASQENISRLARRKNRCSCYIIEPHFAASLELTAPRLERTDDGGMNVVDLRTWSGRNVPKRAFEGTDTSDLH